MLEGKIKTDLKSSLKEGKKAEVSVLRMILSAIKNKKIEEVSKTLDDEKIIGVIQKMARQHKESIEQFKQGGREDLVEKETEELKTLESYLPEPLTEDELEGIISESINRLGAASMKDMGAVMRDVMEKTGGRADGKVVSNKVKERLT